MRRSRCKLFVLAALLCLLAPNAHTGTIYTNRAAWLAASTGVTNIDFEGIAPPGWFVFYGPTSLTLSGVTFQNDGSGNLYVVDDAAEPSFYDWGSGAVLSQQVWGAPPSVIRATLPSGVTSVGSDIMTFWPYGLTFMIAVSTGDVFSAASSDYPTRAFAGFTSATPIAWIEFRVPDGPFQNLDNFAFGAAGEVVIPEPGTCGLIGCALLAMAFALRRRKR